MLISQSPSTNTALADKFRRYSIYPLVVAGILGLAVSLGWVFDIEVIKRPIPGLTAMNPVTAICFMLSASGMFLLFSNQKADINKSVAFVLIGLVVFAAVLRLLDYFFIADISLDKLLAGTPKTEAVSNRMGPNTAVCFLLVSFANILLTNEKKFAKIIQILCGIATTIVLVTILGHMYKISEFMEVLKYMPMALHTAIGFTCLIAAIYMHCSSTGLGRVLSSPYSGGAVVRILLPLSFILPIFLGYMWLLVNERNHFSVQFNMALLIASIAIIITITVVYLSYRLNQNDRRRIQLMKDLEITHNLLKSSIESQEDVLIFSIDKDFNFINYNQAFKAATYAAYGTTVKMGGNMLDCITNIGDREKAYRNCEMAMNNESHITTEVFGDMELSFFQTHYNPLKDYDGNILGVTIMSLNVTEQRNAELQIMNLNKELEAYTYSVAHDLRSPLRVINGYSSLLIDDHFDNLDDEAKHALRAIQNNTHKMNELISDLLDYSRLGKSDLKKSKVEVKKTIESIISETVEPGLRDKVAFKFGRLENLKCDQAMIKQVFSNLISNAVKYSSKKEQPLIEIDSFKNKYEITYLVRDNGSGFDMKFKDNLFKVFKRLHNTKDFEGNGVGLAIVEKIISKHGGRVWAEGEVNKGAVFYFSLPN